MNEHILATPPDIDPHSGKQWVLSDEFVDRLQQKVAAGKASRLRNAKVARNAVSVENDARNAVMDALGTPRDGVDTPLVAYPESSQPASRRRIYVEGEDGGQLSDREWNARRDAAQASAAAEGERTFAESYREYRDAREKQDAADDEFLATFPEGFVQSALERHGRELTLKALRGEAEFPSSVAELNKSREAGVFTHASTGEQLSLDEVAERLGAEDAARIGQEVSDLAELADKEKSLRSTIVETADGPVQRQEGLIDPTLTLVIDRKHDAGVGDVQLIVTEPQEESPSEHQHEQEHVEVQSHVIEVVNPRSEQPEVLIDKIPVTTQEAGTVEAVIAEAKTVLDDRKNEQRARQERPAQRAAETAPKGFDAKGAAKAVFAHVEHYMANPAIDALLRQAGVDPLELRQRAERGELRITPQAYDTFRRLSQDASPRSSIWNEKPGNGSTLQRAAADTQRMLISTVRSL